jgi:hypothetical protein
MIRVWLRDGCFGLVAAIVLVLLGSTAQAETRVALVIGNGDYKHTSRLANPRNDATDVAAALKRLGFETIVGLDLDKAGMDDIEIRFTRAARDADMAMVYYSGHAIQYAGTNYLLPVDAQIKDSADLRRLARVDDIVADLQQAKDLRILVLDSCRDNPLADELKRSLGERSASVQRGLARLGGSQGMIVAYSTQAGQTANDGGGRNSPYTEAFLKQIETPQEISTVFRRISFEVYEKSEKRQLPELSLSLFQDFYLRGTDDPGKIVATPAPSIAPEPKLRTSTSALEDEPKLRTSTSALEGELKPIAPPDRAQGSKGGKLLDRLLPDTTATSAAQRVVLYDEDPANPKGNQYVGTVKWRTEQVKAAFGMSTDVAVRADIEIPGRKLKVTLSFRRNTDASLPASHTAELTFVLPPDFDGGGIGSVPGILMKANEQARGTALAGLAVKVTDGFFLVGLSNVDADRNRNLALLKERAWFDVPLVYSNGRRAIIAIEKGDPGERAYAQAFAAWGQ